MHQNAPFQRRKYKNLMGRGPYPLGRGYPLPKTPLPSAPPFLGPPPNHISGYGPGTKNNLESDERKVRDGM